MEKQKRFNPNTIKRLLIYIKPYRATLVLVTVCIIISALASAASSMFLQTLIDNYIVPMLGMDEPVYTGLIHALITIGTVYALGALSTWIYNRQMVTVAQGTLKSIRDEMFTKMQRLPIRYFDTHTHGDTIAAVHE